MMPQTLDIMERLAAKCRHESTPDGEGRPCYPCRHVLALVQEVRRLTMPCVVDSTIHTGPVIHGTIGIPLWRTTVQS